jgi:hypothetical protein
MVSKHWLLLYNDVSKNYQIYNFVLMKRILFILEYFKPHVWGSETLFDHVIQWLVTQWYEITVLTSRYDDELLAYEQIWYGKETIEVVRVGQNRYDFMRYGLRKSFSLLREKQYQLIQTATFNAALVAGLVRLVKHLITGRFISNQLSYKQRS